MSTPIQMTQPSMFRSWLVVLTSALFFFYIFIQMNLFSSINTDLVKEFHFNAKQLSYLFAFFSYGNLIFLFPAGIMLDRLSVRKLLFIAFAVSVIATYAFSVVSTFWAMNALRLIIGFTGAFSFLTAVKLASRWFEPRHIALAVGVIVTMGMLGGVIAQTPLTMVTQQFGWRIAIQLVTALGAILIILQLIFVRDEPKGLEKLDVEEYGELKKMGFWHSLGATIANKQNWLSGLYISLINLPLFIFGGIWGVPYLTQAHHFTQIEATEITSMLFIGMIIGSPLSGLISDRMGLRKRPMIIGALVAIAIMAAVMFAPTLSFAAEICLYLALGLIMGVQVIGYPVIAESNPHTITASATSLASFLIVSGNVLAPVFGWLLDRSHGPQVADTIITYTQADFINANYLMLIGMIIALIASLLIRETYCKQLRQRQAEQVII